MKKFLYVVCALVILTGCEKELSLEGATPQFPVIDPEPADTSPVFQLTAFYSDKPIDFDASDGSSRLETDLWKYVKEYVKDDHHVLRSDGTIKLLQNGVKMPGVDDEVLYRTYSRGSDNLGEYLVYLDADYEPIKYRLYEWSGDHFLIGVKWKDDVRLFSRFERIK